MHTQSQQIMQLLQTPSINHFKNAQLDILEEDEALARLNDEFEPLVERVFKRGITPFFSKIFCDTFLLVHNDDEKVRPIESLKEFTRTEIASYFLSRNLAYARDPSIFVLYILEKFRFLWGRECFSESVDALLDAIDTNTKLAKISITKYSEYKNEPQFAMACFLYDYRSHRHCGQFESWACTSVEPDIQWPELSEALPRLNLHLVRIVAEFALGFNPRKDGLSTVPASIIATCDYFTDRWLFTRRSEEEEKQKDALEKVEYEHPIDSSGILFKGMPPALVFEFKINSPHAKTYMQRLTHRAIEEGANIELVDADEKTPMMSTRARETQLARKDDIQVIFTQEKMQAYCQSHKGMRLGSELAIHLGLLSANSIHTCVEAIRNREVEREKSRVPMMSAKEVEAKCKPLKKYVGVEFTDRFKSAPQKEGLQLLRWLRKNKFDDRRWKEVMQILQKNLEGQDPNYVEAVKKLGKL